MSSGHPKFDRYDSSDEASAVDVLRIRTTLASKNRWNSYGPMVEGPRADHDLSSDYRHQLNSISSICMFKSRGTIRGAINTSTEETCARVVAPMLNTWRHLANHCISIKSIKIWRRQQRTNNDNTKNNQQRRHQRQHRLLQWRQRWQQRRRRCSYDKINRQAMMQQTHGVLPNTRCSFDWFRRNGTPDAGGGGSGGGFICP